MNDYSKLMRTYDKNHRQRLQKFYAKFDNKRRTP